MNTLARLGSCYDIVVRDYFYFSLLTLCAWARSLRPMHQCFGRYKYCSRRQCTVVTTKRVPSQTLVRGLQIIETVAEGVLLLPQIAEKTGINYSTAHRIASALLEYDYLRKDSNGQFHLGRKLIELGFKAYSEIEIARIARPILKQLADETSDTIHLAMREQDYVTYLDKILSRRAVEISSRVGGIKPLISTGVGKSLLLSCSETEWGELFDRQSHLMGRKISKEDWLAEMREYKRSGYTYDKGEDESVIRCVAAPIYNVQGETVAAVSVSSAVDYMDEERM